MKHRGASSIVLACAVHVAAIAVLGRAQERVNAIAPPVPEDVEIEMSPDDEPAPSHSTAPIASRGASVRSIDVAPSTRAPIDERGESGSRTEVDPKSRGDTAPAIGVEQDPRVSLERPATPSLVLGAPNALFFPSVGDAPPSPPPERAEDRIRESFAAATLARDAAIGLAPDGAVSTALRDAAYHGEAASGTSAVFVAEVDPRGSLRALEVAWFDGDSRNVWD